MLGRHSQIIDCPITETSRVALCLWMTGDGWSEGSKEMRRQTKNKGEDPWVIDNSRCTQKMTFITGGREKVRQQKSSFSSHMHDDLLLPLMSFLFKKLPERLKRSNWQMIHRKLGANNEEPGAQRWNRRCCTNKSWHLLDVCSSRHDVSKQAAASLNVLFCCVFTSMLFPLPG